MSHHDLFVQVSATKLRATLDLGEWRCQKSWTGPLGYKYLRAAMTHSRWAARVKIFQGHQDTLEVAC